MPVDVVITEEFSETATTKIVGIDSIPSNWEGVDIGPKTREIYADVIKILSLLYGMDQWVYSEMTPFAEGTKAVGQALADAEDTYSVIGGGDSAAAVENSVWLIK